MASNARGTHVSPGVYSLERDITYAVKSLGITTLGVAGETLRGPAFQPMHIQDWRQFTDVFGGTSAEKFKGSQYPKYELPYIAKSYLTESKQLEVVRVLGLSGYKAGPAWVVTAKLHKEAEGSCDGQHERMVVAVLRSRGYYEKYHKFDLSTDSCECPIEDYDRLVYRVGEIKRENGTCDVVGYNDIVKLKPYTPLYAAGNDCDGYEINSGNTTANDEIVTKVSATNYGRFTIVGLTGYQKYNSKGWYTQGGASHPDGASEISTGDTNYFEYPVSLNPYDKDFILKVIGSSPDDGDAPIYCESLYDVSLAQGIKLGDGDPDKVEGINKDLVFYNVYDPADYAGLKPITGMLRLQESGLQRTNLGQRYVADEHTVITGETKNDPYIFCHPYDYETNIPMSVGKYFTVSINGTTATVTKKTNDFNEMFSGLTVAVSNKVIDSTATSASFTVTSGTDKSEIESELISVMIDKKLLGQIFTVTQYTDDSGKRHYYYRYYPWGSIKAWAKANEYNKTATDKNKDRTVVIKSDDGTSSATVYTWGVDLVPIVDRLMSGPVEVTGATGSSSSVTVSFKDGFCTSSDYTELNSTRMTLVRNLSDGLYYRLSDEKYGLKADGTIDYKTPVGSSGFPIVTYVNCDLNNYASPFRYASTPWIVSNLKGDYDHIEMNKLFRFHTISDGNNANYEVKISIENIRPDEGCFDVVVRDINDLDEAIVPLEKYYKCTLTPGDRNFIGYKIGTFDGMFETKSKFVTVEVAEGDVVEQSVPAGFLGYPMAQYDGTEPVGGSGKFCNCVNNACTNENFGVVKPKIKYNLYYDNEVKNRKQYFGLSTRVGVDIDTFTYKGKAAYIDEPGMLSQGFHLDSRLDKNNYSNNHAPRITVDGEEGYEFDAVSVQSRTSTLTDVPAIGTETLMQGSIYEYVNLRKFTVYFYGGFDGWDPYRTQRTNTDDFKMSKYLGTFDTNSGEGYSFNRIDDPEAIGLNQGGITSDWYAYLAAYRQFANPEAVDINVFTTPGIDYVNNNTLVNEVIDMVEEERADSIYVVTTPDKPNGASDSIEEMYTPDEAVFNLEDSEIDSNYTCTYYPWIKYLDQENNQYIYLPPTRDVVRNFAMTDNTTYPWFAPAGLQRGDVTGVRAHFITKLADEDVLYEGRINPIKTFATDGIKIWGQKNLQAHESQLDRIAVRRLLLRMRKLIAIACRSLIFEPNDPVTKNSFLSAVTPIMDNIRANRGISDYRIEVNDTVESRDRHELPATIYFKPYGALEYILLDFVLTPEGLSFDAI